MVVKSSRLGYERNGCDCFIRKCHNTAIGPNCGKDLILHSRNKYGGMKMRKVGFLILMLVAMLTVVSCADNKKANNTKDDTTNNQAEENNGEKENNNQSNLDQEIMKLGETGLVKDGVGEYEITLKSVEVFEERNGEAAPYDDEAFMLIDYTIKNVGEESFPERDILGAGLILYDKEENTFEELTYHEYDFVDEITEEIEPGESYDSQFIFLITESPEYMLQFGSFGSVGETEWVFTDSEIEK